jgi:hypothetical protein
MTNIILGIFVMYFLYLKKEIKESSKITILLLKSEEVKDRKHVNVYVKKNIYFYISKLDYDSFSIDKIFK